MAEHQVRRLPVVEEDGGLVGMLAQADVAKAGHDTLTGDVVQKISQVGERTTRRDALTAAAARPPPGALREPGSRSGFRSAKIRVRKPRSRR